MKLSKDLRPRHLRGLQTCNFTIGLVSFDIGSTVVINHSYYVTRINMVPGLSKITVNCRTRDDRLANITKSRLPIEQAMG